MPNRADYTPKIKKVSVKNTGFRKHAALYGKKTVLIDENTGIPNPSNDYIRGPIDRFIQVMYINICIFLLYMHIRICLRHQTW